MLKTIHQSKYNSITYNFIYQEHFKKILKNKMFIRFLTEEGEVRIYDPRLSLKKLNNEYSLHKNSFINKFSTER